MAGAKPGVHVVQLKPISVPESLIKGNKFIKWDESSTIGLPVTLKVDPNGHILYWKEQSKDMDHLDISLIRDSRTGKYAKIPKEGKLRDTCTIGPTDIPLEDKTVSVCYGTDMVNVDWVHFVCAGRDVAKEWADEILTYATNLLAQNSSVLTYLEKAHTKVTHVLDVNGRIPVKNIVKLVATHRDDRKRVEKALEAAGFLTGKNETIEPNKFTFEHFFNFYRNLVGRTEVDKLFDEVGAKKKPYLTAEQFVQFLNKQQRDSRLNEILYPYYTHKQSQASIDLYETKTGMAAKGHLSQEGFLKFLMSEENNLIPAEMLDLKEDMTQPIPHYFINSSHNTYLTGHQLTGKSSVEIYRQVLLSGCRCIELDCWDGRNQDEEPVITHGFTMCTEVSFKEVVEAIAESAFKTSDYPVILSFENHCSQRQQAKMADHCRNIFGDMLITEQLKTNPLEPDIPLPSPETLKRKIIIKNKKKIYNKEIYKRRPRKSEPNIKTPIPSPKPKQEESGEGDTGGGEGDEGGGGEINRGSIERRHTDSESGEEKPDAKSEDKKPLKEPSVDYDMDSDSDSSDEDVEIPGLSEDVVARREQHRRDKGTAGSEAEAGTEMSELVNYIQPVHFHSFDISEKKKRSYEISSFVETQSTTLLKESPVEFVNYNKRQLSRIYPRGTRVDSGNFMPQIFWNAGCQLVALNFQTLDLAMQLNMGIFEYNNKSGYIIKPDFMRRSDRRFDPFAESTVDGIVAGTVTVKVLSGQLLSDKKVGTFVEVDMFGLPTDTVRKRFKTRVVPANGINPVYGDEPFVFKKVVLPNLAVLRLAVYEETGRMIGHRVLPIEGLRPGYRHIPLRNECNQPLLLPSIFVHLSMKDYVPDSFAEFADALTNPIAYLDQLEKHTQQLAVLLDEEDHIQDCDILSHEPMKSTNSIQSDTVSNSQNSSPTRRNGSLPSITPLDKTYSTNSAGSKTAVRMPSQQHMSLQSQESSSSGVSQSSSASGQLTRMVSGSHTLENGSTDKTISIVDATKLNDPILLSPTPLSDLKTYKQFVKAVAKRDKELEVFKRKHEKARENMKDIHEVREEKLMVAQVKSKNVLQKTHEKNFKKASKHGAADDVDRKHKDEYTSLLQEHEAELRQLRKTQSEVFVALCKDQFRAEKEVYERHHDMLYETLRQLMEVNHCDHRRRLTQIHDNEMLDLKKRMNTQSRDDMKALAKKHKDKQELSRVKREAQQKHVKLVVDEGKMLKKILEKQLEKLDSALQEVKKEFDMEKEQMFKYYTEDMETKSRQVAEQVRDSLEGAGKDGATSHEVESTPL